MNLLPKAKPVDVKVALKIRSQVCSDIGCCVFPLKHFPDFHHLNPTLAVDLQA